MAGPNNGRAPEPPSEQSLQRFIALQEQRLALEMKQADYNLRELDHNQKLADKSIEAQAEDRKDERRVQVKMNLHRLLFSGLLTIAALIFVAVALSMGKDAIVLDLFKITMGFIGGWGAQSYVSSRRAKQAAQDDD